MHRSAAVGTPVEACGENTELPEPTPWPVNKEKARTLYSDFLALCKSKDVDPGQSIGAEVRRELAALN
jgi:hypothetical protein